MIDETQTHIHIERTVEVPAAALWALLADPSRHHEIDGSGTVQSVVSSSPIVAVGDVFTMAMHRDDLGDYTTDNHVVQFEAGRRIAWETARQGDTPPGFRWAWELEPVDPRRTLVAHTYDWSLVTDPAVLARVKFPRVSAKQMHATISRLVAVVDGMVEPSTSPSDQIGEA